MHFTYLTLGLCVHDRWTFTVCDLPCAGEWCVNRTWGGPDCCAAAHAAAAAVAAVTVAAVGCGQSCCPRQLAAAAADAAVEGAADGAHAAAAGRHVANTHKLHTCPVQALGGHLAGPGRLNRAQVCGEMQRAILAAGTSATERLGGSLTAAATPTVSEGCCLAALRS